MQRFRCSREMYVMLIRMSEGVGLYTRRWGILFIFFFTFEWFRNRVLKERRRGRM